MRNLVLLAIPMLLVLAPPQTAAESATSPPAGTADQRELCDQLAGLFRAARTVLSDSQDLINDPGKGDKGLSAQVVVAKASEIYLATMRTPLPSTADDGFQAQAIRAMLAAVATVMDKAQPLINEPNKGFKGFLPAVFAGQVAAEFSRNMEGRASIKLTAPDNYIRNRKNRPDAWESNIIEGTFRAAGWVNGASVTEHTEHKGRPATRLILPEYYTESCLKCHGDPKGELDITGGMKEGGKLGELGGAVSVVIYDAR